MTRDSILVGAARVGGLICRTRGVGSSCNVEPNVGLMVPSRCLLLLLLLLSALQRMGSWCGRHIHPFRLRLGVGIHLLLGHQVALDTFPRLGLGVGVDLLLSHRPPGPRGGGQARIRDLGGADLSSRLSLSVSLHLLQGDSSSSCRRGRGQPRIGDLRRADLAPRPRLLVRVHLLLGDGCSSARAPRLRPRLLVGVDLLLGDAGSASRAGSRGLRIQSPPGCPRRRRFHVGGSEAVSARLPHGHHPPLTYRVVLLQAGLVLYLLFLHAEGRETRIGQLARSAAAAASSYDEADSGAAGGGLLLGLAVRIELLRSHAPVGHARRHRGSDGGSIGRVVDRAPAMTMAIAPPRRRGSSRGVQDGIGGGGGGGVPGSEVDRLLCRGVPGRRYQMRIGDGAPLLQSPLLRLLVCVVLLGCHASVGVAGVDVVMLARGVGGGDVAGLGAVDGGDGRS
mmetsp:Transcript_8479/g.25618  ORF Transcript_8479/g.25618 Transcript_8479/m.25618 type:complete len:451 (-) Transcript_8479:689-2041(-)